MAPTNARKTALCGLFCGLSVVVLSLGSVLPLATFCAPALAGLCIFPIGVEFGLKTGLLSYLVSSLLSAFFCPDREAMCIFVFLLGYYPLVKPWLDKLKNKPIQLLTKILLCNGSLAICYGILLLLVGAPTLRKELADAGIILLFTTILLGNIAFLVYDKALVNLFRVYLCQFRPKIFPHSPR